MDTQPFMHDETLRSYSRNGILGTAQTLQQIAPALQYPKRRTDQVGSNCCCEL